MEDIDDAWSEIGPQAGKQKFAMSLVGKVDFMLWGGSRFGGKSEIMTMTPLLFIHDPKYRGIFFRNTYGEITGANSLWDKAQNYYPLFDGWSKQNPLSWNFPSKAVQFYSYMDQESDKESHRGKGYTLIGFDEIDKFSQSQITFMFTCLRSEAEADATMIGTLNPNPDSWCLPLVEWYLDEEGFPDPDKCGVIRYFIIDNNNEFIFGPSEEYFKENYPEYLHVWNPKLKKEIYVPPKTFTYVFFNIYDNEIGMEKEQKYLLQLNNLPEHEKKTQLLGNWYARPKLDSFWSRDWVRGENGERVITRDQVPSNAVTVRGLDKAYTEPHDGNRTPDYTALSPQIKKKDGAYYLLGDYLDVIKDNKIGNNDKPVIGRFRKAPQPRDELIIKQLEEDNRKENCILVLPKDSGGGKGDATYLKSKLLSARIPYVDTCTISNLKDKKVQDFLPFANACQAGLVYIVEESFHPETLKAFYKELENFNGEPSTPMKKDDWCDAVAIAFNELLAGVRNYTTPHFSSQGTTLITDDFVRSTNTDISEIYERVRRHSTR